MTTGLVGLGERELDDGLVDGGEAVEQELRVEAGGDVLAVDRRPRSTRVACASSPEPASRVSAPSLNASWTAVLRSATSATRLTDSISAALSTVRDGQVLAGEQAADLGELAVEQPGRRTTCAAGAGALEADDALAGAARGRARW